MTDDTSTELSEIIDALHDDLDMSRSERVEATGRRLAGLRD